MEERETMDFVRGSYAKKDELEFSRIGMVYSRISPALMIA